MNTYKYKLVDEFNSSKFVEVWARSTKEAITEARTKWIMPKSMPEIVAKLS